MASYPEPVFQNHMVHHPLLQYQMLFPSLLMSLGAPKGFNDDEDLMIDDEGKVNTMDYLRFSALANQLAITQINQVLMDIVMETPGDDIKKLRELQKNFMELIKKGFSQLNQEMMGSKTLMISNNQFMHKQEDTLATLQDTVSEGFLNGLADVVALQESVRQLSNRTTMEAKEFQGKLLSIEENLARIQDAMSNITDGSLCCQSRMADPEIEFVAITPPTEAPKLSEGILLTIQDELRNLTKALLDSNSIAASNRAAMVNLIEEKCSNISAIVSDIDLSNMTREIEERLADHSRGIQSQLGKVDSNMTQTQDDLRVIWETLQANLTKSETELQTLKQLTMRGFADIVGKIQSIYDTASHAAESSSKDCPKDFFAVGEECFALFIEPQMNFEDAEEVCKTKDAHLAEPKFLLKFLSAVADLEVNNTYGMWMGGRGITQDTNPEEESRGFEDTEWKWVNSGEQIDHSWNLGQPSPVGKCLILYDNGLGSSLCYLPRGFVCQGIA